MSEGQPPARGRGALLAALKKKREEAEAVGVRTEERQGEPPAPRGRAALLKRFAEQRAQAAGTSTVSTSQSTSAEAKVEQITESVQNITFEEKEPVSYRGESGKPIRASCNYIKLNVEDKKGVYEYEVRFNPEVDAKNQRIRLVNTMLRELELVKVFDGGHCLYLPTLITDTQKVFNVSLPDQSDSSFEITIIFKRKKGMGERECLHLYNVLFKRIMHVLLYTQMGRKYYTMEHRHLIPQHKLEVLPGFAVSVDELEGGLLLCLDTSHRVLRTQTVYDLLMELRATDPQHFKDRAIAAIIGSVVFTRHNNMTYIIDDIAWDMNPQDTFETRDGSSISFVDYFHKQYNLVIRDKNQPLLINRKNVKISGSAQKEERFVCLIPELCYLTGLTDELRSDFKVMKDVAQYTRVTPHQRMKALMTYLDSVSNNEKAKAILKSWGLSIAGGTIDIHARTLQSEVVFFGNDRSVPTGNNVDWNRALAENKVTGPVNLMRWMVFHTSKDSKIAQEFAQHMVRLGPSIGCDISHPKVICLPNDRNESYMNACKQNFDRSVQIAVFICPSMRTDRYSIIKKICCNEMPIASQVINSRTLSNPSKVRSIILKIALQMNCKLGGTLWTIKFPFKGWMICGIDVYHSTTPPKGSVCGLVCSLNESITRWYSSAIFQTKEMGDFYKMKFKTALEVYLNQNGAFPSKIVIIRDGVGDGQLDQCKRYEVEQFADVLKAFNVDVQICFIVVQKRINTRIYALNDSGQAENPPAGTVMDHTVTRRYLSDFYLVPQSVRQGTVNPTHYIVLYDSCNLKPDHVQRLCYKLCHLYYNWPGTIRVPAPCQYAHKLAALVGQHIKTQPSPELCDKLFYL